MVLADQRLIGRAEKLFGLYTAALSHRKDGLRNLILAAVGLELGHHIFAEHSKRFHLGLGERRAFAGLAQRKSEVLRRALSDPVPGTLCAPSHTGFLRRLEAGQGRDHLLDIAEVNLEEVAEVPKRYLIGHFIGHLVHLRQFVDAALERPYGFILCLLHPPVDALGAVVIFVDLDDVEVEADDELGVRPGACKEVPYDFRLIHAQKVI